MFEKYYQSPRWVCVVLVAFLISCNDANNTEPLDDSKKYGTVVISGADTNQFGSNFAPTGYSVSIIDVSTFIVNWVYSDLSGEVFSLLVSLNSETGEFKNASYKYTHKAIPGKVWKYSLSCSALPCSGLSADINKSKITFTDVVIPIDSTEPENQATAGISIDGTLVSVR